MITLDNFKSAIPNYIVEISKLLHENKFESYLVGGCIRDLLIGIIPSDFDIATNATPEEIIMIFEKSIATGAQFGTITVVVKDEFGESHSVEVTTYRSEEDYVDGRWPSKVKFTKNIIDDLARRDFTINAIAFNLENFYIDSSKKQIGMITEYLIDPFGGVNDLKNRLIRCVGNPIERLSEDGLRSVRGCRFAAQLQFDIHPETKDAMSKTLHITKHVSIERFRDELLKLLYKSPKPSVGINHMKDVGILEIFIPELLEGIGVEQPEFHTEDVYNHTLSAVDVAADNVKIAALFHDIAKPRTKSVDSSGIHFYGHDVKGAEMTRDIMKRLKFPNAVIEDTALLVKYHMFHYPSADWRKANLTMDDSSDHGWSDGAIRRLIKNVGGDEQIEKLLALRLADATSNKKAEYNRSELTLLSQRISEVRAASSAMSISDLDISGDVLMQHFGIKPSKMLGDILKTLLEKVIDNPTLNKRETLLELAEEFIKSKGDKSI